MWRTPPWKQGADRPIIYFISSLSLARRGRESRAGARTPSALSFRGVVASGCVCTPRGRTVLLYTRKVWWRNGRGSEPERLKLKSKVDLSSSVESGHLSWRDRGARSKTVCRRARAKFGVLIQNGTCSFEFDAMNAEIRLDLLKDGRAQLHRTRLATHHS